jgi:hypothetical protein
MVQATKKESTLLKLTLRHLDVFCGFFPFSLYSYILRLQMSNSEEGLVAKRDMEAHRSRRELLPEHRH